MRRANHRPVARTRRGGTLPFVCVMLTAILGGAALAVDVGRVYLTAGEAQAAADAAAVAGARFLQQYTGYHAGSINTSYGIAAVSPLNRVAGASSQVTNVQPVSYDPVANAVAASSWSSSTSAVTVTVSATPAYVFAGALGLTPPAVSRKATAWIANLNGATCVRPFALPYTRFYEVGIDDHNTVDSTYTKRGAVAPEYSLLGVATLQPIYPFNNPPVGRTYTAIPQWEQENAVQASGSGRLVMGRWIPADFGGGVGAVAAYAAGAPKSAGCQAAATSDGDLEAPIAGYASPSNGDVTKLLRQLGPAMTQLCNRVGSNADAHCYDSTGAVGVRVRVFLADSVAGTNTAFALRTREVTMVRVMCYFQGSTDVCAPTYVKDENSTSRTSAYWQMAGSTPTANTGYPAGTITVLLDGPTNVDMTPDLTFGTKPAITQRVFLVR